MGAHLLRFTKMHGAGNDFVVIDHRDGISAPDRPTLSWIADRHFGVGCDQVMLLEPPHTSAALASYRIVNSDGSDARQCGNGARCLAAYLHRDGAYSSDAVLDSPSGPVEIRRCDDGEFEVTLGLPEFAPERIPMQDVALIDDRYRLTIDGTVIEFGAVSIGNPHIVIEVDDVARAPTVLASLLQHHPAFPGGCNVGFVQVLGRDRIRLRVIEQGAGETLACGSGACAAHAWLHRTGRVADTTTVELPGGALSVHWAGDNAPARLRGPTAFVFEGTWTQ